MKSTIITLTGLTTLALVSCENPADSSNKATTSEAKEVASKPSSGTKWSFTDDSKITFVGSKVTGSHDGGFRKFSGHFFVDNDTLAPNGHEVTIDMSSTYSDDEKLTGHLKSADFFEVETYPTTTFIATDLKQQAGANDTTHVLTGNLNLHGVEKSIEIPVTVAQSEEQIDIDADFFINRFDFNIVYPGKTDNLIREEVVIRFDLTAKPAAE